MIKNSFKILIAFFLLPLVWQYATKYEWMLKLETLTLKFRYFIRGNIDESQLKKPLPPIFLVNLDQKTLEYLGEEPIPVSNYAKAIYALTMLGKSRTLASNVVFNEKQYSSLVDRSRLAIDEKVCHQFLSSSQNFILGAWFGNLGDINKVYLKNTNPYPLIYKGFEDFDKNQNPLRPSNRMVGENINLGILNGDDNMNTAGAFRWIPLFARTKDNIYYSFK